MDGIRAELAIDSPAACPVAAASTTITGTLTEIDWASGDGATTTEQFVAPSDADLAGFEPVFDYGSRQVYEFDRDTDTPCVCEFVDRRAGPVVNVESRDGAVRLTLVLGSVDRLRELLPRLRDRYGDVTLVYLARSHENDDQAMVPVDLERLTDRQREVLRTAHGMGYFAYPRDANGQTVAAALDIDPSTFAEHLAAAQATLMDELLPTDD